MKHVEKTFHEKGNMKIHVRVVHLKVKSHICTLCDRGFASSTKLAMHIRSHTRERSWKCDICPQNFCP